MKSFFASRMRLPRLSLPAWRFSLDGWLRGLCYALFLFSPFSIAATDMVAHLLLISVIWLRFRELPTAFLPRSIWLPFASYPLVLILTQLGTDAPLENIWEIRGQLRVLLPLVLLPALARVDLGRLLQAYGVAFVLVAMQTMSQSLWVRNLFGGLKEEWWAAQGHLGELLLANTIRTSSGFYSHHLTLAGVTQLASILLLCLAWNARVREDRLRWGLGALGALVALLASLGRGGWLGAFVSLMLFTLRLNWRWVVLFWGTGFVAVVLMAQLLFSGALQSWMAPWYTHPTYGRWFPAPITRLLSTSMKRDQVRFILWEAALNGFLQHPWKGNGFDGRYFAPWRDAASQKYRVPPKQQPHYAGFHAHNIYLRIGFSAGLLGLVSYLLLWGTVFIWGIHGIRQPYSRGDPLARSVLWGTLPALGGSMVFGVFQEQFLDGEVLITLMLFMGLALHAWLRIQSLRPNSKSAEAQSTEGSAR